MAPKAAADSATWWLRTGSVATVACLQKCLLRVSALQCCCLLNSSWYLLAMDTAAVAGNETFGAAGAHTAALSCHLDTPLQAETRYKELAGMGLSVSMVLVGNKGKQYFSRRSQYNVVSE
jgi:hypothetical protein